MVGEKDVIVGGALNVKPDLLSDPIEFVTVTSPVPPVPTTAVIVVEFTTVNDAAGNPPKLTAVIPVKFEPEIVIVVPLIPAAGLNPVMSGAPALFLNTDMLSLVKFDTTISGLLSPSRSQIAIPNGERVVILIPLKERVELVELF